MVLERASCVVKAVLNEEDVHGETYPSSAEDGFCERERKLVEGKPISS